MTSQHTFLRDSEWASIEGKLCLATTFVPMSGNIVNGAVVSLDQTKPYASVRLKLVGYDGDVTGYVTNKLDFAMLWAAFNENSLALDGVYREPSLPSCSNLSALPHEVWLLWTRKRYSWPASWLPKVALPKLIVMIAHEGTFEEFSELPQYAARTNRGMDTRITDTVAGTSFAKARWRQYRAFAESLGRCRHTNETIASQLKRLAAKIG